MSIEGKIEKLEGEISSLTSKVTATNKKIETTHALLEDFIDHMNGVIKTIGENFGDVEANFASVIKKIDSLKTSTTANFGDVKTDINTVKEELKEELKKIQDVTGYEGMGANMKIIKSGK